MHVNCRCRRAQLVALDRRAMSSASRLIVRIARSMGFFIFRDDVDVVYVHAQLTRTVSDDKRRRTRLSAEGTGVRVT